MIQSDFDLTTDEEKMNNDEPLNRSLSMNSPSKCKWLYSVPFNAMCQTNEKYELRYRGKRSMHRYSCCCSSNKMPIWKSFFVGWRNFRLHFGSRLLIVGRSVTTPTKHLQRYMAGTQSTSQSMETGDRKTHFQTQQAKGQDFQL